MAIMEESDASVTELSPGFKSKECDNWLYHFEKFYQATGLARKSNENRCKLTGSVTSVINFIVNKAVHAEGSFILSTDEVISNILSCCKV